MTKLPSFLSGMFPSSSPAPTPGKREPSQGRSAGTPRSASGVSASSAKAQASASSSASVAAASSSSSQVANARTITPSVLQEAMDRAAAAVESWDENEMVLDSLIQEAVRNHGRVDLMHRKKDKVRFAVKRMPNRWVREGPADFNEQYPSASERPWVDIGLVRHLNSIKYPYACELQGVFRDGENTYVCSSLATKGDLFAWCEKDPKPGAAREEVMIPLAVQIFSAVRLLHELGIAHRDLSLENILLTEVEGDTRVQLIDFGMSTTTRFCRKEVRGKQSYQAPEMHVAAQYDAYLADAFSLGVVIFAMAVQDYPWTSTKKNTCQLFEYITTFGFQKFLKKRKLRKGKGEHLSEVFSAELADLLQGMIHVDSTQRLCLGESCFGSGSEAMESVWDRTWIKAHKGANKVSVLERV
eukprot:TRINITY_DN103076_c0_g1_i1.p1 TRINITY_DN103076_c0_g1~~TRINITY_DN103076_c0_g1_i1.p1  ORF type:complete len:413 (+),score=51.24 TRINITY_DN103076_c0_g1_i1:111-1349(+)